MRFKISHHCHMHSMMRTFICIFISMASCSLSCHAQGIPRLLAATGKIAKIDGVPLHPPIYFPPGAILEKTLPKDMTSSTTMVGFGYIVSSPLSWSQTYQFYQKKYQDDKCRWSGQQIDYPSHTVSNFFGVREIDKANWMTFSIYKPGETQGIQVNVPQKYSSWPLILVLTSIPTSAVQNYDAEHQHTKINANHHILTEKEIVAHHKEIFQENRDPHIRLVDYPGARSTKVAGINDNGDVVGTFHDQNNKVSSFLFSKGRYEKITLPKGVKRLWASNINDAGDIVGRCLLINNPAIYGFSLINGTFRILRGPTPDKTTIVSVNGINSDGTLVGSYELKNLLYYAFMLKNSLYQMLVPTTLPGVSTATAINKSDVVIGNMGTSINHFRGFIYKNKKYKIINEGIGVDTFTSLIGINNAGQVLGYWGSSRPISNHEANNFFSMQMYHYFILSGNMKKNINQTPGAKVFFINAINNKGQLAGWLIDKAGYTHGFVMDNPFDINSSK